MFTKRRSTALGIATAAGLIAAESVAVVLLMRLAANQCFESLYLLGVVVISIGWGWVLAMATSAASAVALAYFHSWPTLHFVFDLENVVVVGVFLVVALLTNMVASVARSRAVEAAQGRVETEVLAAQQAALRRVATLVARGVSPSEVFSAVADELVRCLGVHDAAVLRFNGDDAVIVVASHHDAGGPGLHVGERLTLEGENVATMALRTKHTARIDGHDNLRGSFAACMSERGFRSGVSVPIVVGDNIWGIAMAVSSPTEPMPVGTESRIADFADLVATAVANAATRADLRASRDRLGMLAEQQVALRRVATLVARGVGPSEVFSAVAKELARCLNVDHAWVCRYEIDGTAIVLASHLLPGVRQISIGERLSLEGDSVVARVLRTGCTARIDDYDQAPGSVAALARQFGFQTAIGAPIIVDDHVWGAAMGASSRSGPLPADSEQRIAEFADLAAMGIAAATGRADLIASRARIVAAADGARRRIERDLHDGAQQRLVSLGMKLRVAQDCVPAGLDDLKSQLSEAVSGLTDVSKELQELSRGIHPAILSNGGLPRALEALARRSAIPVSLEVRIEERLPDSVEVTAYYVLAEALTNAAKHAHASEVTVRVQTTVDYVFLSIHDDGIGGADSAKGSGLIGLRDRIEVVGGHMRVASPVGRGTRIHVTIPLDCDRSTDTPPDAKCEPAGVVGGRVGEWLVHQFDCRVARWRGWLSLSALVGGATRGLR